MIQPDTKQNAHQFVLNRQTGQGPFQSNDKGGINDLIVSNDIPIILELQCGTLFTCQRIPANIQTINNGDTNTHSLIIATFDLTNIFQYAEFILVFR